MQQPNFCRAVFIVAGGIVWAVAAARIPADSQDRSTLEATAARQVDFETDIAPLLQTHCLACHGSADANGGLRLDQREMALTGGDSGPVILPGNADQSLLIERVAHDDPDMAMPPDGSRLTADEIDRLVRWIEAGAEWPEHLSLAEDSGPETWEARTAHWSFQPLVRPEVPRPARVDWVRNEIDRFILSRLEQAGLGPSPEADRRTLVRRVYYNLTGLPPTPEQVASYVDDPDPLAYERLVEELLASPRYGERWARHWLDVVHFAETHGHDQDRPREHAWPYRDYVIESFNTDKPYGRFVEEQLAADALYADQPDLIPALGFLAAGAWDESSLRDIREDTLDREIGRYLDRDDIVTNVMSTFMSTTAHCARCHTHKFDPIPQADYYALQAVFAGTEKGDRLYDPDPTVHARRQELLRQQTALQRRDLAAIDRLMTSRLEQQIAEWEAALDDNNRWHVLIPVQTTTAHGTQLVLQDDGSLLAVGETPEIDVYTVTGTTTLTGLTSLRLELLTDGSLPQQGPGRQDNGNMHLNELRVQAAPEQFPDEPFAILLQNPTADHNQEGWDVARSIDGHPQTAWGIFPEVGKPHVAVYEFVDDVGFPQGTIITCTLEQTHGGRHTIGRFRLLVSTSPRPVRVSTAPPALTSILAIPRADRTHDQQREVVMHFLAEQIADELQSLPSPRRVYAGAHLFVPDAGHVPLGRPRAVHMLRRGEITQPIREVAPGALTRLPEFPGDFLFDDQADESARRAALAHWITDPRNPLTWRSIVNRVWQYHFGAGLVQTPNDLGRLGADPSHPELLDWLAVTFRDGGGSLKDLHRLILLSATYRQVADHREDAALVDAGNRLLWRMNRQRLDAEQIRDSLVQFSGRLDLTMGGPSVRQFVMSPGVHVTPEVDYAAFDVQDPANDRRAIYRFLFRTLPDPLMETLDCPAGDQSQPVRTESITPLQALTMLNNPFVVHKCAQIAECLAGREASPEAQVQTLLRLTLQRDPEPDELLLFRSLVADHGLASLVRVVINSNEFLFLD